MIKLLDRTRRYVTQLFGVEEITSQVRHLAPWFLLYAVVGLIAGLGAVAFYHLLEGTKYLFLELLAGYHPGGPAGEPSPFGPSDQPLRLPLLALLPGLGGLVSGLLVQWLAPEAEGHGTDAAIDAYHHRGGQIRTRVPFVKALTSAITIGTGGSAGREGPIAQIGAGLGSTLAKVMGIPPERRRIIMAAGMGAGIGAIFRAPLAGAIFAAEVMYSGIDFESEVLVPSLFSSIVAYSVFGLFMGWQPMFATPSFAFHNPTALLPFTLLAVIVAFGARAYVSIFYAVHGLAARSRAPKWLRPAIGGVAVGAIVLVMPQAMATGFGTLQQAILGTCTAELLFAVAILKILTTAGTVATGESGGVFGPAVVVGGCLGGGVGVVFHAWWPHLVPAPGAFALVGMAGFFSAAASAPISTVIMVSEMSGDYSLLVPTMWVSLLAFMLVRGHTIYKNQLPTRLDSPVHAPALLAKGDHRRGTLSH